MKGSYYAPEQPMTARTNKSLIVDNGPGAVSSNASAKAKQYYKRQSTFSSDAISAIKPLKSTTSA